MDALTTPTGWIFLAASAVWLLLVSGSRLDRLADDRPGRLSSIEGLRGVLALMVVGHHFAITRQFVVSGRWELTPSPFWNLLGQCAVALFFMITGFLFADKIRRSPEGLRTAPFLVGRILRLYPVYLGTITAVIGLGLWHRGATSAWPSTEELLPGLGRWLMFDTGPLLGWPDAGRSIAFTPWSLQYEAVFYLSLPIAAAVRSWCRPPAWVLIGLAALGLYLVWTPVRLPVLGLTTLYFAPFILGALVSIVPRHGRAAGLLQGRLGVLLSATAVGLEFATQQSAYAVLPNILLALAFLPIALGNTLATALTRRPVQFLGAISYDIYLLHGLVLYGLFAVWPKEAAQSGTVVAWLELTAVGVVVIPVSLAAHRLLEVPGQRLSASFVGPASMTDLRLRDHSSRKKTTRASSRNRRENIPL